VENTLTVARTIGIRFLALCASTLFLVCFTRGQSADEVHLSPQRSLNSAESTPDTTPAEGLTATIPHSTPLRVNVDVVLVPVTVSDSENRPVTTLTKQDFALFEEDKRQEIRYFSTEEAPLSVAILLDVSKSMSDKIDTERAAIVEFFRNAHPDDEYFAITFSDRPRVLAGPT
jgi:Ca-activated chloride channel homolog